MRGNALLRRHIEAHVNGSIAREPAGRRSDARRGMLIDATLRCLAEGSVDRLSDPLHRGRGGGLRRPHQPPFSEQGRAHRRGLPGGRGGPAGRAARRCRKRAPDDPREKLSAFFRNSFSPRVLDPKLLRIWTAFWTMADSSSEVRAMHEETYGDYRALLEQLLAGLAGQRSGQIDISRWRPSASPRCSTGSGWSSA